jgi:hypothetical protein
MRDAPNGVGAETIMKRFVLLATGAALMACVGNDTSSPGEPGFRPTYVLAGTVRDSADMPVPGATVLIATGYDRGLSAVSNQSGYFKLVGVIGTLSLRISKEEYEPYQTTLDIRSDTSVDLTIRRLAFAFADTIEFGRTIRSYVYENAVPCDPAGWDARAPCRRFYFTPSSAGVLAVEIKWDGEPSLDATIVTPSNSYVTSSTEAGAGRILMSASLAAGVKYEVRVNSYYGYQAFDMTAVFIR